MTSRLDRGTGTREAFYDTRYTEVGQNKDGTPMMRKVRRKYRSHAFIFEDEGKSLTDKMKLSGSEHSATIRRAWSGSTFGQEEC